MRVQNDFQTYSDVNGVTFYNSFIEAFNAYQNDKTIWKISFDFQGREMIWRPKTKNDIWKNEDCLMNLSEEYAAEQNPRKVFWIRQSACNIEYLRELIEQKDKGEISSQDVDRLHDRSNIKCVLNEDEFVNMFRFM